MALRNPVTENDHIHGPKDAPVELVEYGDFQCPHCGRAYPIVKALLQDLGDNVRFVFRHFPLANIHPQATIAAIATEAAGLQNKFWEMYNIVFQNQRHLTSQALIGYAKELGLNMEQFTTDMQNKELEKKVESSFYGGMRSGVSATPTFFINGEKYTGSWEDDDLGNFIRQHYLTK